jgi:sterol desaturase/sphingolipid hydroxylase (fatty acid hydroxylase superfamily)
MWIMATPGVRLVTGTFNYWFGFLVDATVAGWFLARALTHIHHGLAACILLVLAGLGLYGMMEYLFHRWVYHGPRSPAATGHLMHHQDPQALIGLPFFFPAMAAFALWFLFRRLIGDGEASLMMTAVVANFLYYGLLHHSEHHGRPKAKYFQTMRSHHLIHHHSPECNFGLTMTFWDWVFGTHYLSGKRSRPGIQL